MTQTSKELTAIYSTETINDKQQQSRVLLSNQASSEKTMSEIPALAPSWREGPMSFWGQSSCRLTSSLKLAGRTQLGGLLGFSSVLLPCSFPRCLVYSAQDSMPWEVTQRHYLHIKRTNNDSANRLGCSQAIIQGCVVSEAVCRISASVALEAGRDQGKRLQEEKGCSYG